MIVSVFHLCFRFGRKKVIIGSLILAAVSSIGAVLLTTEDDSNKGKCFIERDSNFVSFFERKYVFLPDWSAFQRQQKWISKPCSLVSVHWLVKIILGMRLYKVTKTAAAKGA